MNRNDVFDSMKGIGICLVYLGHLLCFRSDASRFVFLFHVPLFFFVSGYFFNHDRYMDARRFAASCVNGFLIPWVAFTVVGLALLALTDRWTFPDDDGVNGVYIRLVHNQSIGYNGSWFLFCLLVVKVFYRSVLKGVKRVFTTERGELCALVVVLAALFYGGKCLAKIPNAVKLYLPFSLASVPMALYFFGAGNLVRRRATVLEGWLVGLTKRKTACFFAALALMLVVWWLASLKGPHANLAVPIFPKSRPYFFGSMLGIAGCSLLATAVSCKVLSFIGRHSLFFFMAEMQVGYFCKLLVDALPETGDNVRVCLLLVLELLLSAAVVWPMERLVKWMREAVAFGGAAPKPGEGAPSDMIQEKRL